MQISFQTSKFNFLARFDDSQASEKLISCLPLEAFVRKWGDEIYFKVDQVSLSGTLTSEVQVGDVAWWPEGNCLCVFFGPTPESSGQDPVPASPVIVLGKTVFSPEELRSISEGEIIKLSTAADNSNDTRIMSQNEIDSLIKQLRG